MRADSGASLEANSTGLGCTGVGGREGDDDSRVTVTSGARGHQVKMCAHSSIYALINQVHDSLIHFPFIQ